MMTQAHREKLKDALNWSSEIECCSDKSRYAFRVWDLFDETGISALGVPCDVVQALKDLQNWEECAGPCRVVEAYLERLVAMECEA